MSFDSNESGFCVGVVVLGVRLVVRSLVIVVVLASDVPMPEVDSSSPPTIHQMPRPPSTNANTAATAASGIHGIFDPPDDGG